jgi:hypothetical protein
MEFNKMDKSSAPTTEQVIADYRIEILKNKEAKS